jgi:N-acetylmuramoyl-L-alanine amidase
MTARFSCAITTLLILGAAGAAVGQIPGPALEFYFAGNGALVPQNGDRVEIMPILGLIGAEAAYSPAAGTYGVVLGDKVIQFAPGRKHVLVNGTLLEAADIPLPSPGGISVTLDFLERYVLSPFGFHLEPTMSGYLIMAGPRFAEPVAIRPAIADFDATSTLVLTLSRSAEAEVEAAASGIVVRFRDASPQVDSSTPFRSRRIRALRTRGQELLIDTTADIGLLSWHVLGEPQRIIIELGRLKPTPTPAPVRVVDQPGPSPIVIDPGHGGDDTGAVASNGLMEKDLTVAIARRVANLLEARGRTVRLTRSSDENRALTDRTALANRLQAKIFVSLHANSSTASSVRGAETYYMSLDESATDAAAAAIADIENRAADASGGDSQLELILWDLAQAEVLNESSRLALAIQARLNDRLGLRDRGVKQAPFVVLTGATMPAALVEVGFLSNPNESHNLTGAEYQQHVAEAIALGILDFLGSS